jgi:hypothetical protein
MYISLISFHPRTKKIKRLFSSLGFFMMEEEIIIKKRLTVLARFFLYISYFYLSLIVSMLMFDVKKEENE